MKKLIALTTFFIFLIVSQAFAGVLITYPRFRAFDATGAPLSGGLLYTYLAGTSTNRAVYTNKICTIPDTNPVVLDPDGEATIYGLGSYKLILRTSAGSLVWSHDGYEGGNDYLAGYSYPDYAAADHGATGDSNTIKYYVDTIGPTNKATIFLRHNSGSEWTDYVYATTDDYTSDDNITFIFEQGARLAPALGITVTGPFSAGLTQIFTGAGSVVLSSLVALVRPEWDGAVADGTTDCATAISTAIERLFASNLSTLTFSNGTYYLGSMVTVNFDNQNSLRLTGTSSAATQSSGITGGTKIIGAASLESMFLFTKTDLTTFGLYAFEADHIAFFGDNANPDGSTSPYIALLNKVGGGPARPFNVHHCDFRGFYKAIASDLTIANAAGLTTGICQVNITQNSFSYNDYALYGNKQAAIMDLNFSGNVSEQGGKILTENLGLIGTVNITDNLLEGQVDAIVLNTGFINGEIRRNYFEGNTGYIINVSTSREDSRLAVGPNYYTSIGANVRNMFAGMHLTYTDTVSISSTYLVANQLQALSTIDNTGIIYAPTTGGGITLNRYSVSVNTESKPGTMTDGAYKIVGGSVEETPIGPSNVLRVTSAAGLAASVLTVVAGDWVVAQAFARRVTGTGNLSLYIYNNASVSIGNESGPGIRDTSVGEWVYICRWVQATAGSAGTLKWRLLSVAGTEYDVTNVYLYKITGAPAILTTPIYLGMPALQQAEIITAVAHTAIIPRGVTRINSTLGAIAGLTLADGENAGNIKTILMTHDGGDADLSVVHHETSDPEAFTFDDVGDALTLQWTGGTWVTLHNFGVTVP